MPFATCRTVKSPMLKRTSLPSLLVGLLCVLALVVCEAVVCPVAEVGIADDWSYVRTAQVLASTGHVVYNGWSTAMLGWQLYWGALFLKLFGDSFFSLRFSVFVLAVATTVLLFAFLLRCGLQRGNAALGTVAVVLSPLFLPLAFNYMSDVPGLLCLLLCMYCALRALESGDDTRAVPWLIAAIFSNVVLGSARQICWLGLIVLVPTALWMLRSRRRVVAVGVAGWLMGLLSISLMLHWFLSQPYSIPEKLFMGTHLNQIVHLLVSFVMFFLGLPLYVAPLWIPLLLQVNWRSRQARLTAAGALAVTAGPVFWLSRIGLLPDYLQPTLNPVLSPWGIWDTPFGPIHRPLLLQIPLREWLSAATLLGFFAVVLASWWGARQNVAEDSAQTMPLQIVSNQPGVRRLAMLFGPFTLSYLLLLVSRSMYSSLYDRYLLLVVVVLVLFTLLLVQRLQRQGLYAAGAWSLLAAASVLTVMMTHDSYARYRARLVAIDRVLAAGVPRTQIRGELEFDGMTEILTTGYVNERRLVNPAGAYKQIEHPATWMDTLFPSVNPVYVFLLDADSYGSPTPFEPVRFTQWLGQHQQVFYTRKSPPNMLHTGKD